MAQRLLRFNMCRALANAVIVVVLPLLLGGGCSDYTKTLPGGYLFVSESADTQDITRAEGIRPDERYIPCNVVGYDYNASHIIAKQVARTECFANGVNLFNQRDGQTYFWIIDVQKKVIHGPYSEPEFAAQRKQLDVSEELKVDKRS